MHIELLVEEQSMKVALDQLLRRILEDRATYKIIVFNGKPDLLRKLPARLKAYRQWIPPDYRLVILIDEDRQDCQALKLQLEKVALDAGFTTKSAALRGDTFEVLNRIAIEELEAWYFGDVEALVKAYPRIPPTLGQQAKYRAPDAIAGGTWETLERLLQQYGYHQGGLEKLRAAEEIARHMQPERNRSKSFQAFHAGLIALVDK